MNKIKRALVRLLKAILPGRAYMRVRTIGYVGLKKPRAMTLSFANGLIDLIQPSEKAEDLLLANKREKALIGKKLEYLAMGSLNERFVSEGISIIVLNRNGSSLLEDFFASFKYFPNLELQLVFVDHNSNDSSIELVKSFQRNNTHIEIDIITKTFNDSFSASNNEAVGHAIHENILFLNNDVILSSDSDVLHAVALLESNPDIAMIGWDLYYDDLRLKPQHQGITFEWDARHSFYRPENITGEQINEQEFGTIREYPAVTMAIGLCRKNDFLRVGGFDPKYNYGFEDVDLCLKLKSILGKKSVIVTGLKCQHLESVSQANDNRIHVAQRRLQNVETFRSRFGYQLRRIAFENAVSNECEYKKRRTSVGFVVTEAGPNASAGDYFTALELSREVEKAWGAECTFIPQRGIGARPVLDCAELDIIIIMIDRFDPRKLTNLPPQTIVIAWIRNWFDRWASWSWFKDYNLYFVSSNLGIEYFSNSDKLKTNLLRLGVNERKFYCAAENTGREIEICFTGSSWGVKREIEDIFPVMSQYNAKVFGHGWEDNPIVGAMYAGAVKYDDLPRLYSRTKIVVDDGAASTKKWNSVNSRVYDALAAGCLVISNSKGACDELAIDLESTTQIPTFTGPDEFQLLLNKYLLDETERVAEVKRLQASILSKHSYKHRAGELYKVIEAKVTKHFRIVIKVPAPSEKVKMQWGDYHFADSLRSELKALGHSVRIDLLPDWYGDKGGGDDVVIVLRGLSKYTPSPDQINIMWNISHPEKVLAQEYQLYDLVYVASPKHVETLKQTVPDVEFQALLQCTDTSRFYRDCNENIPKHELLFVGNSRNVYRDVVRYSLNNNLPVSVYGGLWDQFLDGSVIRGQRIDNQELRKYYSAAEIVLNDHWETMRETGFISNRIFDAVACGAIVVSDAVSGISDLFGDSVVQFDGSEEGFVLAVKQAKNHVADQQVIRTIASEHSFKNRAMQIEDAIFGLHTGKMKKMS